jgi:hypothetical protein
MDEMTVMKYASQSFFILVKNGKKLMFLFEK